MASDASRAINRVLAPHDSSIQIWNAECSLSGLSPRPGVPEPDQATRLVLDSSGSQSAGGHLRVVTLHAGVPEIDGARFAWRNNSDASTLWRGWEPPATISGYEGLRAAPSGTLVSCSSPHSLGLADGTVVAVYQTDDSGRAPDDDGIEVSVRSPTADTWSTVTVYSTSFALPSGQGFHPCLLELPSGRLQLYHWVFDPVSGTLGNANVRMWYSDNQGATWAVGASYVLREDVPYNTASIGAGVTGYVLQRLRCAYFEGQVVLVAWLQALDTAIDHRDTIAQWYSDDDGASFRTVNDAWSGLAASTAGGMLPEVLATDQGLVLLYISPSDRKPRARRIAAAAYDFETASAVSVAQSAEAWATVTTTAGTTSPSTGSTVLAIGDLAACVDETGAILVWGRQPTVAGEGVVLRSEDGGDTWTHLGQGSSTSGWSMWWQANDTATYPTDMTVAPSQGRVCMVSRFAANPGTGDDSLVVVYLGGYTTMTLPGYSRFGQETERVSWERTWLPFDPPASTYWTAIGAGSQTLSNLALSIVTTAAQTAYNSRTPLGTLDEGLIVEYDLTLSSGGSVTTMAVSVLLRLDDGAEGYAVSIRHSTTGFRLFDQVAGTAIGAVVTDAAPSSGLEVRIAVGKDASGNGAVAVWYRAKSNAADRVWTVGPSSSALTDNAGAAGSNLLSWGHQVNAASTSVWRRVLDVSDQWAGRTRLCEGQTNPDDLLGRTYSARGVYLDDGLILRAVDGPTVRGDLWSIEADDEAPLVRVLAHGTTPSPRVPARWDADVQTDIAVQWSDVGDTLLGCDSVLIGLFGSTIGRVQIDGYDDDTSSWVTIATVDTFDGLEALPYTRVGQSVGPSSTAPGDSPTLLRQEARGWYAWTYASSTHYSWPVRSATEGKWTNATTRRPVLRVEAGSTHPASGTLHLVPDQVAIVLHLGGVAYSGLRLRVPAASSTVPRPPDGEHQLGTLVIAPVVPLPEEYSWGRVLETEGGAELVEQADGTRSSRVRAVPARLFEVGWTGGVDTSAARSPTHDADPDYLLLSSRSGATPAALRHTTPTVLEGVLRELDGEHGLAVYLPRVPKGDEDDVALLLNRREQLHLVRMQGPVRVEVVVGEELDTELVRIATVTLREET